MGVCVCVFLFHTLGMLTTSIGLHTLIQAGLANNRHLTVYYRDKQHDSIYTRFSGSLRKLCAFMSSRSRALSDASKALKTARDGKIEGNVLKDAEEKRSFEAANDESCAVSLACCTTGPTAFNGACRGGLFFFW